MMTVTGRKTAEIMWNTMRKGERRSVCEMLDKMDKTFMTGEDPPQRNLVGGVGWRGWYVVEVYFTYGESQP